MTTPFQEIVRMFGGGLDNDQRAKLLVEVAANYPEEVAGCARRIGLIQDPNAWKQYAQKLVNSNQFVEAIKFCRQETGWGLKEAKDACDLLREAA